MRQETQELLYAAIDELNAQSAVGLVVEKSPDSLLLGGSEGIDSLAFINLMVAIEEQIQQRLNRQIVLIDENYISPGDHPFRTVATLGQYIERVLDRDN